MLDDQYIREKLSEFDEGSTEIEIRFCSKETLEIIAKRFPNLENLMISDASVISLDFSTSNFPNLQDITVSANSINTFDMPCTSLPKLAHLDVYDAFIKKPITFDLPQLVNLNFERIEMQESMSFAKSLSKSTALKQLSCCRIGGLEGGFSLVVLPNCEYINMYRCVDMDSLILYAPKLNELNLAACFRFNSFHLLDREIRSEQVEKYYDQLLAAGKDCESFFEKMQTKSKETTEIARSHHWISDSEEWDPEFDSSVENYLDQKMRRLTMDLLRPLIETSTLNPRPETPKISISTMNANISEHAQAEMEAHPRIGKDYIHEDANNGWVW